MPTTKRRLLDAAGRLFAQHGFHAASVRAICDQARANPGAVSYHFGGKKPLYRAVLRRSAERLAAAVEWNPEVGEPLSSALQRAVRAAHSSLQPDDVSFRLILRDLADGGDGVAEAVAPLLRSAYESLLESTGLGDEPGGRRKLQLLLLRSLAPAFLLVGLWPILQRGLGLQELDRPVLLAALLERDDDVAARL